ncbi:unnamed protein product [Albugo candida]|uniref:Uncharacterized protein n=1 Tax=Albugo candida TaxID=65357 RepID=A0A024GDJ7_9STRA|nr:unnamed protein product [Albugo candida]|eukprot:CCI44843.1 unnamed protein product [Albugo candida]
MANDQEVSVSGGKYIMVCALHSSRNQFRYTKADEAYSCPNNSQLGVWCQSGEVSQGYESLKLYLGGEYFQMLIMRWMMKREKSVSVTAFILNGMAMSRSCKKQHLVALSTMEAEFVASLKASQELLGARELFNELNPMILWMDNQAAISQFLNEATSIKDNHIDVRQRVVRADVVNQIIAPSFGSTEERALVKGITQHDRNYACMLERRWMPGWEMKESNYLYLMRFQIMNDVLCRPALLEFTEGIGAEKETFVTFVCFIIDEETIFGLPSTCLIPTNYEHFECFPCLYSNGDSSRDGLHHNSQVSGKTHSADCHFGKQPRKECPEGFDIIADVIIVDFLIL